MYKDPVWYKILKQGYTVTLRQCQKIVPKLVWTSVTKYPIAVTIISSPCNSSSEKFNIKWT